MFQDRRNRLRTMLVDVTQTDLERPRTAVIAPAWGEEPTTGAECSQVLLEEYSSHRRYAERDLAALEAGLAVGDSSTTVDRHGGARSLPDVESPLPVRHRGRWHLTGAA